VISNDDMERRLMARLDERAALRAPQGLADSVIEGVERTRQLPGWATSERWISMDTRARFGAVPRAIIVLATLAVLTALAAGAMAIGASTTKNVPAPFGAAGNGLIAFVSDGDIHVVEPDGSGLTRITSGPGVEDIPTWSRDGTKLAYWTEVEDGSGSLLVIDAEGNNAVMVAETSRPFSTLMWSADGQEIMYDAVVPELVSDTCPYDGTDSDVACGSRLFVAATDGTGSRQVGDPDLTARSAVLSPDGHTVAFGGGGDAGTEALYLMDWDGSNVRRVDSVIRGDEIWPFSGQSWSPDGRRIATHDGNGTIWVVALDDMGGLESVERLGPGYFPIYAPTGSSVIEYNGVLYVDDLAGLARTPTGLADFRGRWSPDATHLARIQDGNLETYDLDSEVISVITTVEPTLGLTGAILGDDNFSWQRLAF